MFPRHSAFKAAELERGRHSHTPIENEAPGPLRVGSTRKLGVTEVPTHVLEQLNESLRRMASYTNLPTSLREELEGLADDVYSQLPG